MPSNKKKTIEQAKFTYSPLGKAFEKQTETIEGQGKKQVKAIHDQGEKQIKTLWKRIEKNFFDIAENQSLVCFQNIF